MDSVRRLGSVDHVRRQILKPKATDDDDDIDDDDFEPPPGPGVQPAESSGNRLSQS